MRTKFIMFLCVSAAEDETLLQSQRPPEERADRAIPGRGALEQIDGGKRTWALHSSHAPQLRWTRSATCRSICNLSILNQLIVISTLTSQREAFRLNTREISVSGDSATHATIWHGACICNARKVGNVAQRSIEILVGRLLTDETFRSAFLKNHATVLEAFSEAGHELTTLEIAALVATPKRLWNEFARQIDPRLQKANLGKGRA